MRKIILSSLALLSGLMAQATVGGPDGFGYTYTDSNEPGGPIYSWIEIAVPAGGSGTLQSPLSCDDCHQANIPLAFNFPYYGGSFNMISISSNGTVYFEDTYLGLTNSCIPGTPSYTMTQYNFIAHMWDDLAPNYQGGIYTQSFADYFVIEYYDIVPCCTAGDGDTWQVILFSNGNILMQYKELSNQGLQNDLTVGIQNDPSTGLQYVCDGSGTALANNLAILYLAPSNSCTGTTVDLGTGPYCIGQVINAPVNAINNLWSDMTTGSSFTVSSAGSVGLTSLFNDGCSASTTVTASSSSAPVVGATASDLAPCEGASVTLNGTGTDSYIWDNGVTDGVAFPALVGSTIYTVTGTDALTGCSASTTITIDGAAAPAVVANSSATDLCEGENLTLTGSGADTYVWDNGVTDGVQFTPASGSVTYTVTGTSTSSGCSNTDMITVIVNTLPVVAYSESNTTLCTYFSPVTLTEGTPAGGSFSGTGVTGSTFDPNMTTGLYDVIYSYTDANNCSNSDTVTFNVSDCLGMIESSDLTFAIFPNPANDNTTVSGLSSGDLIRLYTLDGKLLFSKEATSSTLTIDLSTYTAGTYLLFVNTESVKIQKL